MDKKIDVFSSSFAYNIFKDRYSFGGTESWKELSERVIENVCGKYLSQDDKNKLKEYIYRRQFIPAGRYLYASGRQFHMVKNCFLFRAEDTREGWADLLRKITITSMTGGGCGTDYSALRGSGEPIRRVGGESSGPMALIHAVNEAARYIRQGGSRRAALLASLVWNHKDIHSFMTSKDWPESILLARDVDSNIPLPLELTNISVNYDTEFFSAIQDRTHPQHHTAREVWEKNCQQAFKTGEPGFLFNHLKDAHSLRNPCVSGDTEILTTRGYQRIDSIVDVETKIWNGCEWSNVIPKITGYDQPMLKIKFNDGRELKCTDYHKFHIIKDYHGNKEIKEAKDLKIGEKLVKWKYPSPVVTTHRDNFAYTRGFYCADGLTNSSLIPLYEPKYSCINRLIIKSKYKEIITYSGVKKMVINTGINNLKKDFIPFNEPDDYKIDYIAGLFDGDGCELKEGGLQLVSVDNSFLIGIQKLLSLLGCNSKIVFANNSGNRLLPDGKGGEKFYHCKESNRLCVGSTQIQELISFGMECQRLTFNKYPQRDASQFCKVVSIERIENEEFVYCFNESKNHTGIFNGIMTGQCGEAVSDTDSDSCNLGTLFISKFDNRDEFESCIKYATKFLVCGNLYSDYPTDEMRDTALKNNRIGLGLGGVHEWLINRDYPYSVPSELHKWLNVYERVSDESSYLISRDLGVNVPLSKRAIAPTGTIGSLAESTTGIEPVFCKAFKRYYYKGDKRVYEYVVDSTIKRMLDSGKDITNVQDSYDIPFKDRVKTQADIQQYVDMAISSTCNLPKWDTELNNSTTLVDYSKILLKYAKRLRGFTCYPNEARGGQPLERVTLEEAITNKDVVFETNEKSCTGGLCGV